VNLETNKDREFALIPVRLKSINDNINKYVSMKYEIDNQSHFTFLGARPEISGQEEVVPKENWPLYFNDKIYPLVYSFNSENEDKLTTVEYNEIEKKDGFTPKYVTYNGTFDMLFRICDYSNNCVNSRTFHFLGTPKNYAEAIDLSGYNITACRGDNYIPNFSTYENSLYKFKIQYPSSWKYSEGALPNDILPDNAVAEFGTQGFINPDKNNFASAIVYVGYWPDMYKEFVNSVTPSKGDTLFTKTIEFNSTILAGYPAFKTVTINRASGMEPENEQIDVEALVGHTTYGILFTFDTSQYVMKLEIIKKILNSFNICTSKEVIPRKELDNNTMQLNQRYSNIGGNHSISKTTNFSTYVNGVYKFKVLYPANVTIREDKNKARVNFDFLPVIASESPFVYHGYKYKVQLLISVWPRFDYVAKGTGLTLEAFAKGASSTYSSGSNIMGFSVIESKPINFKGNSGYEVVITHLDPKYKIKLKDLYIVTIIAHDWYFFEYSGELSNYEKFLPIVEYMLGSFDTSISSTHK
jgi:hypothetical protein